MQSDISRAYHAFLGRDPKGSEGDADLADALTAIVGSCEFRDRVVLPVAAGAPFSTLLIAPLQGAEIASALPLTAAGRVEAAAARTRTQFLAAVFRDRRFVDEVHASAQTGWPPELLRMDAADRAPAAAVIDPVISVLMPVYNTTPTILNEAITSVARQTYPHWELCICDDASTSAATSHVIERWRGTDPRIKITRSDVNVHIAEATNIAVQFATGSFIGLLDHDDLLTPDALMRMADAIARRPEADVLYSDEDKLEPDGSFSEPYLKPDWSPEHLGSVAYLLHFMVVRKSLFISLGGFRKAYTGAQDYDLSLRATARAREVVHVPHILYHWRKIEGSAAATVDAKPQALINAAAAVLDFARSQDAEAVVSPGLFTGSFRIEWPVSTERPVTLLMLTDSRTQTIPGRGDTLMVELAADSILDRSTFRNFELVIVDNGRMPPEVRDRLQARGARIEHYVFTPPFSYPDKINRAFDFVRTEDVVLLNDDIEVISPGWLEALLAYSRRPEVGAVGCRLLHASGLVQHAGVVLGVDGACTHIFYDQPNDVIGYCGYSHVIRNYSAVTGAVLATRMSLVRWVGGFDSSLKIDFNDVDFCLRLGAAGFRSVYTPYATLYHFQGSTLSRSVVTQADQEVFLSRWPRLVDDDPYYNPHLPRDRMDCHVRRW